MVEYKQLATSAGFDSDDSDGGDTDKELKEAFAAGLLKPGLNYEAREKKAVKNNVTAMQQKLAEMLAKPELPWVERLDLLNAPALLAPELAYKKDLHGKESSNQLKQAFFWPH